MFELYWKKKTLILRFTLLYVYIELFYMKRVFFNGDPKIESEERKSRSIEDTKINYKNQIRERQNRLPALLEKGYHIANNVDGTDDKIRGGTSCMVKKK